jgi:long-subunit fatty acid transport protein
MKIFMLCFALFSLFVNQKIAEAGIYNKRLYLIGSRAAGMAGNFNANADDGSALWYNPAGLAKMKGNSISISANTYSYYSTTVENFFNFQANGATETLHADDQRSDFVINPTALIYGFNTGISESVAFGIFSPTSEEMSGILDGQADQASEYRKIHMDYMFNKKTYIAMLGYGFELIPGINLGVNLGLSYSRYELQSYYFHYIYYKIHNHELNYIRQKKVSNFYYGIFSAVGFQFELSEKHKLGLSIKSPFLNLYNKKTETINNMDMNSSFINPSDDLFLEKETHDEFLHQTVPSSMNIGYSFHIPDLMVFSMNIFPSFSSPYSK